MRTLVALVLLAAAARGQADPSPVEPLTLTTPRTAPPPSADPLLARAEPTAAPPWRADLLVGAPLAVRLQRKLGESKAWLEGGGGLYLLWPAVFVGIRGEGRVHEGKRNLFTVRPGFDVYFCQGYRTGGGGWFTPDRIPTMLMPAVDCDLYWEHCYSAKFHGLLGLKLGGGLAVGSFDRLSVVPLPLVALTVGFSY